MRPGVGPFPYEYDESMSVFFGAMILLFASIGLLAMFVSGLIKKIKNNNKDKL